MRKLRPRNILTATQPASSGPAPRRFASELGLWATGPLVNPHVLPLSFAGENCRRSLSGGTYNKTRKRDGGRARAGLCVLSGWPHVAHSSPPESLTFSPPGSLPLPTGFYLPSPLSSTPQHFPRLIFTLLWLIFYSLSLAQLRPRNYTFSINYLQQFQ